MRKAFLAAIAVAAALAVGGPARQAAAMPIAAPSQFHAAAVDTGLVQRTAFHHRYGWRRRHYWGWPFPFIVVRPIWIGPPWYGPHWGWRHRWWGWHHRWHHWHRW